MGQTKAAQNKAHTRLFNLFSKGRYFSGQPFPMSAQGIFGYAKQLSHPAYERMLRSESLFRKLIPLLILVFLSAVGLARWVAVNQQLNLATGSASDQMHLISDLIVAKLDPQSSSTGHASKPSHDTPPNTLSLEDIQSLDRIVSKYHFKAMQLYVSNADGNILYAAPRDKSLLSKQIRSLLPVSKLLTSDHANSEAPVTRLETGQKVMGLHKAISPDLHVTVFRPVASIRNWLRQVLSMEVTLFMGTSSILIVIVYAYFAQSARAQEADSINQLTQNRFDTALANGRCGLWDWDLTDGKFYWSKSMFDILGLRPNGDRLEYSQIAAFIHPDDPSLYDLANKVLVDGKERVEGLFRMRRSRRDWHWIRTRMEVVYCDGKPHLIGIAVDVSEQQNQKRATARNDLRLRDAIENLSEAFVLWDEHNRLVMSNTKYQQMHGLNEKAVKPGTDYHQVMAAATSPVAAKEYIAAKNNNETDRSMEVELEDGRWLQINERKTADGGFVSVGTDITAIKHHAHRLAESESRLLASVNDLQRSREALRLQAGRLEELAQKYSEEKDRAKAANKTKSEFLANISHELRTPLNAIIGFSEIMNNQMFGDLGSAKYKEYCRDIYDSGSYLLGVINDVLDMSKIEAGKFKLDYETFGLHEILEETLRIVSFKSNDKDLTVVKEFADISTVTADRRAIKQIVLNLLSNAVKFSREEGKIEVKTVCMGDRISISIADNGIGISKRDLKKLGKPFEQVQNQFTKCHKGSGLGLAISRSLAEMHQGKLEICSKAKVGTTVILTIPKNGPPNKEDKQLQLMHV